MRRFIIVVLLFSLIALVSCYVFFYLANGSTDDNYLKFTTPKQSSLIIGSSRAAQGLQPKSLKDVLNQESIYNYAFSLLDSPFGEAYFESIKRKLKPKTKQGIFILEINPWTIGLNTALSSKPNRYRETGNFLDNTTFVSLKPNIEYLIESYNKSYINIFKDRSKVGVNETFFVEDDGWLNVTISLEGKTTTERTKRKIIRYNSLLSNYSSPSPYRIQSLVTTIQFLKQHGNVYLVRMPVIDEILEIENKLLLDFNNIIQDIATDTNIKYINMMPDRNIYTYTDGNHLDMDSGRRFSVALAKTIQTYRNQTDSDK